MFRWYREAARCYVYVSDVHAAGIQHNAWQDDFRNSRWFTRGWTLQELLAPRLVEFFSSECIRLGDKISLEKEVHSITGIAVEALRGSPLSDFSVKKRMDWAAKRKTTRKEDEAYSLLGIFDIYMPLIYGERERALVRLREQIDRSIQGPDPSPSGTNAPSTSVKSLHPVRKNYRKVHVTILYWEVDEVFDTVKRISDVFRSLYRYEVREIRLPHRQKEKLRWPWLKDSLVDDRDLQIMYYLGSTMKHNDGLVDGLSIAASPVKPSLDCDIYPHDPDPGPLYGPEFPGREWLAYMIGIPELSSDVVIVLVCFIEELAELNTRDNIRFVLDNDYAWARYLLLFAGYTEASTTVGKLSDRLMLLLEELASSGRFYAREGLITSGIVREKLAEKVSSDADINLHWFGNDGRDLIHLSPLPASAAPAS